MMKLKNIEQFMAEMKRIPWFTQCGIATTNMSEFATFYTTDYEQVIASQCSDKWEEQGLEIGNEFHTELTKRLPKLFSNDYNSIVSLFKDELMPWILDKADDIIPSILMGKNVRDDISWSTIYGLVAYYFLPNARKCKALDVFEVMRRGHIVCGWKGDFPKGMLLYY